MCYFVYCIVLYCILCIVVPLPPGTYPLAVNNNNKIMCIVCPVHFKNN